MLSLLYGTDWIANRDHILRMIANDVSSRQGNRIFLVPELISHDTERRLCAVAGDTCSRYAEVMSFSRLTRRICEWTECGMQECLDNGGRLVAMAAVTRQLHSKLKVYASVETKPEFLTELVDAVDEFKRCCISSKDLLLASQQAEGAFAQKLEELSLILECYEAICQQGKRDPRDQLSWGLELLLDSDFAKNHVFYIDGFPDFTLQNMAVIEHLILNAPHVVVSMNCDKAGSTQLAFSKAGDTASKLIKIATQNNIPVVQRNIPAIDKKFGAACGKLFQGSILPAEFSSDMFTAVQAESIHDECVFAAEKILELVQSGNRYKDIAVVCGDLPSYRNALQMQCELCGIPTYIAGTDDILEQSVIITVLTALDTALGGFDTKDTLRYLKSALSPITLEECDKLENYVILWSIQGKQWTIPWTMHPEGLQENWTQLNIAELEELNEIRQLALKPIIRLADGFKKATHLSEQIESVYEFLDGIHLQERLEKLADYLNVNGDNRSAQIINQLWEILLSALEQMEDMLGQTHWDPDSFLRLFRLLLSQYDVGTIPPVLDSIMFGSVSAMRCQEVKHLILLGAQEGKFPTYGTSAGVLTDQERNRLRQLGVPLTGGAAEGLEIEFSEIYGVFCGATDSITVSCLNGQGSYVFRRLLQMCGGDSLTSSLLGAAAVNPLEAAAYLCRYEAQKEAVELGISDQYQETQNKRNHEPGTVSRQGIAGLYGERLNLSASQIDKQADCRLAYFLKYGLRVKEQKAVAIDPAEFGTYVHAVLENTAREICEMGGFKAITMEQTLEIAEKYSQEYIRTHFSQIDSQRIAYLFQRNDRELMMVVEELWKELQQSSFQPIDFEVAFGDQAQMDAIQIPNSAMHAQLRGFVDRVDAWQEDGRNYFRVVDYKTGKKDFDYCDVFNGLGLQMLLYMFALEQHGESLLGSNPIPVGVQYFPARVPVLAAEGDLSDAEAEAEREPMWKRRGLILGDDDILFAMENSDAPTRLSCKKKKDGSITGDIASREQFKLLSRYVFHLLGKMVEDIASGNVTPNPYTRGNSHNACMFCPYGSVCHAATVEDRRNYKVMSSQRFWDEIGKEMGEHG